MKFLVVFLLSFSVSFLGGCQSTSSTAVKSTVNLPAGITLVDEVDASHDHKIVIPYKKYKMANGLTVILHEDHTDPLVHVDVTYHVGSDREQLGKSGFAHFFEHMMFQGSKHVADEQHFKVITEAGGSLNGSTNSDRTNYFETVPNNQLEKVLWLESDRMGYLLDALTNKKFEVQRATVINERGQNIDNRPYGRIEETINQMIYPRNHRYSWPVIGYVRDLKKETLSDLKQFFHRWYSPNNAVLTIGGDINEAQTLAWVVKYFSDIQPGKPVKPLSKPLISLAHNRYYTLPDNVSLPLLYVSFPTVYAMHKDEPALDVLANILGNGPTSLLYQKLVKTGLAVQAGANHPCRELACKMDFYIIPNPQHGLQLAAMEQALQSTLTDFEKRGVNDDDLLKTKVKIETDTIYGLQSVAGKVSSLAFYQTFTGTPNFTGQEIKRYQAVTKADVMRVYRKYIKNRGAAVLSVVPRGQQALAAKPADYQLPDVNHPPAVTSPTAKIPENPSHFDRTIMPPAGSAPVITVPKLWRKHFANGLTVLGTVNRETPTVSVLLTMEGGPLLDNIDKAGLATMTADMMEQGTTNYPKEQLSSALARLGSDISVTASGRTFSIEMTSLTKNLDATINLLLDVLHNPAFTPQDFARVKNQRLQNLKQGMKNPDMLASMALKQVLFGANKRIGLPDSGTLVTNENIQLADVKHFYQQFISPKHASLIIVGDIDQSAALKKFAYLGEWQGNDYSIPLFKAPVVPKKATNSVNFVDLPGAKQAVVMYARTAMPYSAFGDYFKASLMNYPLGGAFNSRINLNLREDKGYTYGASSGYRSGKTLGYYVVRAGVKQPNTGDAMGEIVKEITRYQTSGLTDQEVNFMRNAITQHDALSYETPRQKLGFLEHVNMFNLPTNYGEQQTKIIQSLTKQALNNIAKTELIKPMQWIVVGDGNVLKPQFAALNLTVQPLKLVP